MCFTFLQVQAWCGLKRRKAAKSFERWRGRVCVSKRSVGMLLCLGVSPRPHHRVALRRRRG